MDQMQTGYLYLMQAMTAPKAESKLAKSEASQEENGFRQLLEDKTEQAKPEQTETTDAPKAEKPAEAETENLEVDEQALQELAAMQMLYVDTAQIIVTQPAQPEPQAQQTVTVPTEGVAMTGMEQQQVVAELADQVQPQTQSQVAEQGKQADTQVMAAETQEQPAVTAPKESANTAQEQDAGANLEQGGQKTGIEQKQTDDVTVKVETPETTQEEGGEPTVFGKVETAPVKVSETAAPAETAKAAPVETQIAEKLTNAIQNGETKVEIQLTPEHLGKVTIELTQKEDGALHVAIHAENSQTRNLLERDLPGLQNLLSRGTQQEVQVEVPRNQENQQGELQDGHQRNGQQQERREHSQNSEDFLNQLRLGLVDLDEAVS